MKTNALKTYWSNRRKAGQAMIDQIVRQHGGDPVTHYVVATRHGLPRYVRPTLPPGVILDRVQSGDYAVAWRPFCKPAAPIPEDLDPRSDEARWAFDDALRAKRMLVGAYLVEQLGGHHTTHALVATIGDDYIDPNRYPRALLRRAATQGRLTLKERKRPVPDRRAYYQARVDRVPAHIYEEQRALRAAAFSRSHNNIRSCGGDPFGQRLVRTDTAPDGTPPPSAVTQEQARQFFSAGFYTLQDRARRL